MRYTKLWIFLNTGIPFLKHYNKFQLHQHSYNENKSYLVEKTKWWPAGIQINVSDTCLQELFFLF